MNFEKGNPPFKNPNYYGISDKSPERRGDIESISAADKLMDSHQLEIRELKARLAATEDELLSLEAEARSQEIDPLTGCANRLMFEKHLNYLEKDGLKSNKVGIIFLDLDNLKTINDTYGHKAGDVQLVTAAAYFSRNIRRDRGDILARIGGDEFAVICLNTEDSEDFEDGIGRMIEERLISRLLKDLNLEFSYGYAVFDTSMDTSLRDTLHRADMRMYEQKQQHKTDPSTDPNIEYHI